MNPYESPKTVQDEREPFDFSGWFLAIATFAFVWGYMLAVIFLA